MVNANNIDSEFSDACESMKNLIGNSANLPSCDISIYDMAWVDGPYPSDTDESLFTDAEDYCDFK